MNQDSRELSFDESVKQIMDTLPPAIHAYLVQKKYTPVARSLMATYGLRIDQGGILERGIMLLLMGIDDPAEFSKALAEEAKLDQKTINGIVQDINEQIFVPLREEMRKGTEAAPKETKPAMPQAVAATTPRPDWKSHASASLSPQSASATPTPPTPMNVKPPQILVPAPPASQRPALRDVLATVMKTPLAEKQIPLEPRKLLEDHEEPHIEFKNKPPTATPNITVPTAPNKTSIPPRPATPKAPPPPPKPYSVDPYREPLDEK